jgi:branched-chain amino acid transport system substrate-binding protein
VIHVGSSHRGAIHAGHLTTKKLAALGVAFALVLGACGSDDDTDSDAASTTTAGGDAAASIAQDGCDAVKIGVLMSTSGPYSQLGVDAKIAADAFSKSHPDILGTPLELQIENDGSDPTQAVSAAQRLLDDDCIVAMVGPTGPQMLALVPTAVKAEKPTMFLSPLPYDNFNKEPYLFSVNLAHLPMQKALFGKYWQEQGVERPVIITGDDATGDVVAQFYGTDYDVERVPNSVTDYEPVVAKLKDAGYDAVAYFGSVGKAAGQIALAKQALNWDVDYYQAPSTLNADYFEVAGDAAEGTRGLIWPAGLDPDEIDDADQRAAVEAIHDAVGSDIDLALQPLVASGWDQFLSLYLAMEEAGSSDPAAVQAALDGQTFYGANGKVVRVAVGGADADHAGVQLESSQFAVVKDGKLVLDS